VASYAFTVWDFTLYSLPVSRRSTKSVRLPKVGSYRITASEIIKDSATGCVSPSPPLANFTTQLSGASDSEHAQLLSSGSGLIRFDPIVGQYGLVLAGDSEGRTVLAVRLSLCEEVQEAVFRSVSRRFPRTGQATSPVCSQPTRPWS